MATKASTKRVLIDKANTSMVITIAVASFITVFSLVASKALISQRAYQARVISEKTKAKNQLDKNVKAVDSLVDSYKTFVNNDVNLIGGSSTGTGPRDGDNAKLVLDALPSKYDFPSVTTSLEKILVDNHFKIDNIGGIDDEIAQQSVSQGEAIDVPYQIEVEGSYDSIQNLMSIFEKSIRPFQARTIDFTGTDSNLKLSLTGKTFYQPEKKIEFNTKDVK